MDLVRRARGDAVPGLLAAADGGAGAGRRARQGWTVGLPDGAEPLAVLGQPLLYDGVVAGRVAGDPAGGAAGRPFPGLASPFPRTPPADVAVDLPAGVPRRGGGLPHHPAGGA